MSASENSINLLLVANDPATSSLLKKALESCRIDGIIRRVPADSVAVECARQSGSYQDKTPPDLILFDFTEPTDDITAVLRDIAFSDERARVPVVLLTNTRSQQLLDEDNLHGNKAIMFSPTRLSTFVSKFENESRANFLKALGTLYQYGPIVVELPPHACTGSSKALTVGANARKHFSYAHCCVG